ncbi:DUF4142 domain-containing protein [Segetibacter sp. 3557_3]|uniref:DUF4142 domain-containing protein n=1 Tax=Segetibacter sp. 3557_3 TaxID=2547429 RepID=UPI0010588A6E|nr:DUF4142 domain-containing protein [Segetibacter sp. 3557_3]TDH24219.1 DUF4142 domain-containing protein [Segetibacter sp. 3557_3]
MKLYYTVATVYFLMLFAVACNSNKPADSEAQANESNENKFNSNEKSEEDTRFVVEAASGGLLEVTLGNLAQQNAAAAPVKEYGQSMAMDHSKANQELQYLAEKKNITLPTKPGADHQKLIDELTQKKGAAFDKAYMQAMVEDHEEDIAHFQKQADTGTDVEIKAFAQGKIRILQHHLDMAKAIHASLK